MQQTSTFHEGQRLEQLAAQLHINVNQVSKAIGITRTGWYGLYKQETLKPKRLKAICNELGLTLDEFYQSGNTAAVLQKTNYKEKYYELLERYNALLEKLLHYEQNDKR